MGDPKDPAEGDALLEGPKDARPGQAEPAAVERSGYASDLFDPLPGERLPPKRLLQIPDTAVDDLSALTGGSLETKPEESSTEPDVDDLDFEEATRRLDALTLDAPLEAPAPSQPTRALEIALPASVLVVDEDRRRGAQTGAKLMEHGYTCRAVLPGEVPSALAGQPFDAALVEASLDDARRGTSSGLVALGTFAGAVVVSSPAPLDVSGAARTVVLKPWLTEQVIRALEDARLRASGLDPLEPSTLGGAIDGPPTLEIGAPEAPVRPTHEAGSPAASGPGGTVEADPQAWARFDAKVVRARIADAPLERGSGRRRTKEASEGFTPGRIRSASYSGSLIVETRRPLPAGTRLVAELVLSDDRRADFVGEAVEAQSGTLRIELEVEAADVPFYHAWVDEGANPRTRSLPVRVQVLPPTRAPNPEPGVDVGRGPGPLPADIDRLWTEASSNLDDDALQQAFIQACLQASQIELAVRRYRALKEAHPKDPRPQRYLQQVGTILGFYVLKQNVAEVEDVGISWRLKIILLAFIFAALILFVIALIVR